MGFKKVWACDHCGARKELDPVQELIEHGGDDNFTDRPPGGWQVISFNRDACVAHVLLCPTCIRAMYTGFLVNKESEHVES